MKPNVTGSLLPARVLLHVDRTHTLRVFFLQVPAAQTATQQLQTLLGPPDLHVKPKLFNETGHAVRVGNGQEALVLPDRETLVSRYQHEVCPVGQIRVATG